MNVVKTAKGTELPLRDLKGKKYLEAAYRVLWAREEHPDWGFETEFLQLTAEIAVAKATVRDAAGKILAQATKTETPSGFPDYVEKAETGAVGRALALCGYGTQFALELDEGERIVDSPREVPGAAPVSQPVSVAPGAYVFTFGKFKGRRMDSMDIYELNSWVSFMRGQAELSGKAEEAVFAAEAFLKTREVGKAR